MVLGIKIHRQLPKVFRRDASDGFDDGIGVANGAVVGVLFAHGKGVAFGPVFPDDKCNMHNADESLDEEKFFKHAQICLEAMYKLFTEKL